MTSESGGGDSRTATIPATVMREWLVVINSDGTVLAVDGGAPLAWIGARLQDRTDITTTLQHVVADVRQRLSTVPDAGLVSAMDAANDIPVRILALHAVPVRRPAINVRTWLQSTTKVMEQQARAIGVALTVDVSADVPPTIRLDPEKLAWALTALIGNALRFVRHATRLMPGGTIRVRAYRHAVSSHVVLEVQDDGSGIPAETLPQLLRRSAVPLQPASLALSLVQDVTAAHGGDMQIVSSTEVDQSGTTVRLVLPCP